MSEETVTFNLELNVEGAIENSRQIEMILYRSLSLWNQWCRILGVPDDSPMSIVIDRAQQIVMMARLIHTSVILLETASGPLGWIKAALGIVSAGTAGIGLAQQFGSTQG